MSVVSESSAWAASLVWQKILEPLTKDNPSLYLCLQLRKIQRIGVLPAGMMFNMGLSTAVVRKGTIVDFRDPYMIKSKLIVPTNRK